MGKIVIGVFMLGVLGMLCACGGGGGGGSGGGSGGPPPAGNVAGFAYVTNQASNDVSAYTIDAGTGALSQIAGSPFAAGLGPTSVAAHPAGKFVYVGNGGSQNFTDTISAYSINATTGALISVGAASMGNSSPRSITVDPSGKFVYTANGGSRTSAFGVSAFAITASGALSAVAGSPFSAGTNPSSVAVDPAGQFAYVTNQASASVSAFSINVQTGELTQTAGTSTANAPLCVSVDPSGRFAYVANLDGVQAYSITAGSSAWTEVAGSPFAIGANPSCVAIDPSGRFAYVTHALSEDVSAYGINSTTGALSSIGAAVAAGTRPVHAAVDQSGKFLYVTNGGSNNVSGYAINPATGALSSVGAPVAASSGPVSIATARIVR